MCIVIIRNNSLVGGRARAEARTSATERVTLYCTWQPSALTTRPHGQVSDGGQDRTNILAAVTVTIWGCGLLPNYFGRLLLLLVKEVAFGVFILLVGLHKKHSAGKKLSD